MKISFAFLLSIVSLAVFSGCAGTAPSAEFKKPISDIHRLCLNDEATVKLVAADGVVLNDVYRQRLTSFLLQKINDKKKTALCQTSDKRAFILNSKITRYDEGNAAARFMLAGLGQIHIDGDFVLSLLPAGNESIAEFTVQITFAWGGIYGGFTTMADVESSFAEGVAEAIVAQATEKKATDQTK